MSVAVEGLEGPFRQHGLAEINKDLFIEWLTPRPRLIQY